MQTTTHLLTATACIAALGTSVLAQSTVVSPARWATVESPSGNAFPFGSTAQQFRYLNVHDDLAGPPRTFTGFAVRRSGTTSTTTTPAISIVVDGWMSTAATTGATVVAMFDSNHGTDKAQVLNAKTVNFPPAATGILPYPFLYQIPLDTPFAFAGGGPLCWEVQITSRPMAASATHDYVSGTDTSPSMVVSRYGDGCTATGRTAAFALTGSSTTTWATNRGELTATASNGPASAMAAWLIGFSATMSGSQPLPFLLPGTTGGASGPCYLNTSVLATINGTLTAAGGLTFRVPVPLQPHFDGVNVFSQVIAPDSAANALGLVTTNGLNHHVVAPWAAQPGGRVYQSGSLAATGTVGAGQTLVVQFNY